MERSKKSKEDTVVEASRPTEEIQVDLEAFTPTDSDIFGIQLLLQQLLRNNVKGDTRLLAELIVKYNCAASIMKQVDDAEEASTEDNAAGVAATSAGSSAAAEKGDEDYEDSSAALALLATLPRAERAINELLQTLIGRLPKGEAGTEKFTGLLNVNESDSLLLVILESIASFPSKIAAAMCAQLVDADLSASAAQYAAFRSVRHVLIVRRASVQTSATEGQSGGAKPAQIEFCFDEDHVFAEFATAVAGFEYATATAKSKKREEAGRKKPKRQEPESDSDDQTEDEAGTNGVALLLLTFEQFVAAVQKLRATYL